MEINNILKDITYELTGLFISEDDDLKFNGIDSLTLVSLIVTIEDEFQISFTDDDLNPENLKKISDIVKLVEKYI